MKLLIVEPASGGHHLAAYVRYVLRECLVRGWQPCLVTTPEAARHSAYESLAAEFGTSLQTVIGPSLSFGVRQGGLGLLRRQFRFFEWHRHAIEQAHQVFTAELALIMSFDAIVWALALRRSPAAGLPFASISIGVRYHWPQFGIADPRRRDAVDRRIFERAVRSRGLRRLFVIDDTYAEYAAHASRTLADKVAWIPDPGEVEFLANRDDARQSLGIDAEAFVVLVYGSIGPGKGVAQLLAAAAGALEEGQQIAVLIAGRCSTEVRQLLHSQLAGKLDSRGALVVRDKFHSPREEGIVFGAADVVWVAYSPSFLKRSAVMCQAASAGRPVIARAAGLVGRCVEQNSIGATIESLDETAITKRLVSVSQQPDLLQAWAQNARAFAEAYTGAAFGRAVCDGLAEGSEI